MKSAQELTANNDDDIQADETAEIRSFTSYKLEIQNAMMKDPDLTPMEVKIATIILSHVNAKTHWAFPSQKLLAIEASCSTRWVIQNIKGLERKGWLIVNRNNRQQPNFYTFKTDKINTVLDRQLALKELLQNERVKQKNTRTLGARVNASSPHKVYVVNSSSPPDVNVRSPEHLKRTPLIMGMDKTSNSRDSRIVDTHRQGVRTLSRSASSSLRPNQGTQYVDPTHIFDRMEAEGELLREPAEPPLRKNK